MRNELSAEQREYLFYRAGTAGVDALRIIAYLTDVVRLAEQSAARTPALEQALAQRDEAREIAQAAQRALDVANADRDALRAMLDASAALVERVKALQVHWTAETGYVVRLCDLHDALGMPAEAPAGAARLPLAGEVSMSDMYARKERGL